MNKLLLILLLLFSACGPTITKSAKFSEDKNPYIALIPSKNVEGISREKLEYISQLVRLKLESKGYILLTLDIIKNECIDLECSNSGDITSKYKIGKIAHINLESSSSIDFLAGYYSSLTGELSLEDNQGRSLYSASHTERDSGGLILESGQVIQAIINQVRNGDEGSIDKVSYRFVSALLREVPKVEARPAGSGNEPLYLNGVTHNKYLEDVTKFCAMGTPSQSAWLISSSKESAELKEIKSGEYCGAFRMEGPWAISNNLKVELRSAFGELVRLEVK